MTIIISSRLRLKPSSMDAGALGKMVRWLNNKELMRYSEQRHRKHTLDSQRDYIESFQDPNIFLEIHSGREIIGTVTAFVDGYNKVADVGILIGEQGRSGFGSEAWKAFCDHLIAHGIRKIEAGCIDSNLAMMNVARKYEMILEGRRFEHFMFEGEPRDMALWAKYST